MRGGDGGVDGDGGGNCGEGGDSGHDITVVPECV